MTEATQAPLLRTVKETAALLGFSESTVWHLIRSGQLASIAIDMPSHNARGLRKLRRIEQAAIDELLEQNRTTSL